MRDIGSRRPMVVTDKGLRATGVLDALLSAAPVLRAAPVFDDVPSNPTEAAATLALALYQAEGCDGLIALDGLERAMGLGATADVADAVHDLVGRLGLPQTLSGMGALSQVLPSIAAAAMLDHCHPTNARPAS
jgi:alcohol dehydrogenase class IV